MTGKKPEKTGHCNCSTDQQYVNPSFEQDSNAGGMGSGGTAANASSYNNRRSSGNFTQTLDGGGGSGVCGNTKDCISNGTSCTNENGCCVMHNNTNSTHRKGHR